MSYATKRVETDIFLGWDSVEELELCQLSPLIHAAVATWLLPFIIKFLPISVCSVPPNAPHLATAHTIRYHLDFEMSH